MEGPEHGGAGVSVTGILIVLLTLGTLYLDQPPLKGARPQEELPGAPHRQHSRADARLWQSPFLAISRNERLLAQNPSGGGSDADTLSEEECDTFRDASTIIGVTVFSDRYFESAESTRRIRYAVVSALASEGLYPKNSKQIPYIRSPESDYDSVLPPLLPYETFQSETWSPDHANAQEVVQVLWLTDQWVATRTVDEVARIQSHVLKTYCERVAGSNRHTSSASFKLLGPAGSAALSNMLKKAITTNKTGEVPIDQYSYSATVSEKNLLHNVTRSVDVPSNLRSSADIIGRSHFWRTIATDKLLAETMLDELALRRITPASNSSHRIALISETDTFYARQWNKTFGDVMCAAAPEGVEPCSQEWLSKRLIRMSYLRGMDGQLASTSTTKKPNQSPDRKQERDAKDGDSKSSRSIPSGLHQFDYLTRLATQLKREDDALRREQPKQSIKAIGIFGSDVYDKLLVLRALRPLFPRALFFTTDLDAIYFSKEQLKWTRNLVVVSSFGLTLAPSLQNGVPPFRDSYQTSAYLSTLFALKGIANTVGANPDFPISPMLTGFIVPRVFEIGRGGAFGLSPKKGKKSSTSPIYPQLPSTRHWVSDIEKHFWVFVLFLALIILMNWSSEKTNGELARRWGAVAVAVIASAVPSLLFYKYSAEFFKEEPLSWTAGISIWPTEALRALGFVLAVLLIVRCWTRQKRNEGLIVDKFELDGNPPTAQTSIYVDHTFSQRGVKKFFMRIWRVLWKPWKSISPSELDVATPVDISQVWLAYSQKRGFVFTLIRVSTATALFLLFGNFVITSYDKPYVPGRGEFSFFVDMITIRSLVIAFLVLIFLVTDITRRSTELCTVLARQRNAWPDGLLERFGRGPYCRVDHLSEWIDIRFVARLTEDVGYFIYFPFLILFILIVSRLSFFDGWGITGGLWLIFLASGICAVSNAVVLERTARKVRRKTLTDLLMDLAIAREQENGSDSTVKQIEWLITEVRGIRHGAFAPVFHQPVARTMIAIVVSSALLLSEQFL